MLRDERGRYESRLFEVEPGARVLAQVPLADGRQRSADARCSSTGSKVRATRSTCCGTARKAYARGLQRRPHEHAQLRRHRTPDADALPQRDDAATSTASSDELAGANACRAIFLAGFSMSGNMVLKLAGDYGADAPPALAGVVAVSPSLDLDACADAIERRAEPRLPAGASCAACADAVRTQSDGSTRDSTTRAASARVRTIRQFDERFTAPHGGYRDAADYYERASSLARHPRIRVPTLIIHAAGRPLHPLRARSATRPSRDNPNVLLVLTPRGGHVGFIAERAPRRRPPLGREPRRRVLHACSRAGAAEACMTASAGAISLGAALPRKI